VAPQNDIAAFELVSILEERIARLDEPVRKSVSRVCDD
jgi:hypothetical protein